MLYKLRSKGRGTKTPGARTLHIYSRECDVDGDMVRNMEWKVRTLRPNPTVGEGPKMTTIMLYIQGIYYFIGDSLLDKVIVDIFNSCMMKLIFNINCHLHNC